MKLGTLIDTLEPMPADAQVRFSGDRDGVPLEFASWRGVYAELTLRPGGRHMTVRGLLDMAKQADGGTFGGYKGGDFTMTRETPVWADDYGDCDHLAITGVQLEDGVVELVVTDISDYRGY